MWNDTSIVSSPSPSPSPSPSSITYSLPCKFLQFLDFYGYVWICVVAVELVMVKEKFSGFVWFLRNLRQKM
jgi:hypothetical protein